LNNQKNTIYLSPPQLNGEEINFIQDAIDSNWIAPLGPHVDQFENEMADYVGKDYAAALSSGTAALHLSLKIIGVKSGDYVFCSDLTFVATVNAIKYLDAKPIFIDSDRDDWTVDINLLEVAFKKYNPKAFICVNIYGQCPDYDQIIFLCKKYNVKLIEDAAESLGSKYKDNPSGSFGDLSILSFNGNKIITTSGGGALMGNDKRLILHAKKLATQARENKIYYEHKEIGYNYRLSNILAGIGRAQLNFIDDRVSRRREIFKNYFDELSSIDSIEFLSEAKNVFSNRWLTTLILDKKESVKNIINKLESNNIESRPLWKPMHLQPVFSSCDYVKGKKDISNFLFERGLCLPSSSHLTNPDQDKIISLIKDALN